MSYQPRDIIRFRTPQNRELEGRIVLLSDDCALVRVEKPTPIEILVDMAQIVGKVSVMKPTQQAAGSEATKSQ